jgi:hypothetical protein
MLYAAYTAAVYSSAGLCAPAFCTKQAGFGIPTHRHFLAWWELDRVVTSRAYVLA